MRARRLTLSPAGSDTLPFRLPLPTWRLNGYPNTDSDVVVRHWIRDWIGVSRANVPSRPANTFSNSVAKLLA